jgi:hypothetical protein
VPRNDSGGKVQLAIYEGLGQENSTLAAALTASSPVISISSAPPFAGPGVVRIGAEYIGFSSSSPGIAPTLAGLTRGRFGTTVSASHTKGARVDFFALLPGGATQLDLITGWQVTAMTDGPENDFTVTLAGHGFDVTSTYTFLLVSSRNET